MIKTDRQKDRQAKGKGKKIKAGEERGRASEIEAGISGMRGDLLKCGLRCDLSTDAHREAQETLPSDRVATPLTDE